MFNYLGEIKMDYGCFHIVPDLQAGLESACDFEMNIMACTGNVLHFSLSVAFPEQYEIQQIINSFSGHLSNITSHCLYKEEIEFTPSDFKAANLTQKELESLF
jgi:non-ribosomal peptide synthase protein (TIGR01720 family)